MLHTVQVYETILQYRHTPVEVNNDVNIHKCTAQVRIYGSVQTYTQFWYIYIYLYISIYLSIQCYTQYRYIHIYSILLHTYTNTDNLPTHVATPAPEGREITDLLLPQTRLHLGGGLSPG